MTTLFIDDGGVMNDNKLHGEQWRRLVAEFFAPILGGAPSAWAEANWTVMNAMLDPDAWATRLRAASGYADFERIYQLDWLGGMCEMVGVPRPPAEECCELAARAGAYITPHVRAAFPGAAEAIKALAARGYILHTASGEPSTDLAGYLEGMGVREQFDRLYGPDLVDMFKDGPEYYERIFADAGVAPADALVVDDSPLAVMWAARAGARRAGWGRPWRSFPARGVPCRQSRRATGTYTGDIVGDAWRGIRIQRRRIARRYGPASGGPARTNGACAGASLPARDQLPVEHALRITALRCSWHGLC